MRFNGQAVVIVGQPDPDKVKRYTDRDLVGVNVWGPYPFSVAQAIKDAIDQEWMHALEAEGPDAFPYGGPSAEVHRLTDRDSDGATMDHRMIAAAAARNWYRPLEDRENDEDDDV